MFNTVLVATDGSALSAKAIDAAIEFAQFSGAKLVAMSVAEAYPFAHMYESASATEATDYDQQMRMHAQSIVEKVAIAAKDADVVCETCIALSFSPYVEIIRAAQTHRCDAIFMASHGRKGLNKFLMGSETQKVLAHTSIPVLVLR